MCAHCSWNFELKTRECYDCKDGFYYNEIARDCVSQCYTPNIYTTLKVLPGPNNVTEPTCVATCPAGFAFDD